MVGWKNPFPNLIQIAVQRSYDSIKRFSTIYSSPSPELPINGFSDKVTAGLRVYYRIFYVMEGGAYYFTPSKRPKVALTDEQEAAEAEEAASANRRDQLDPSLFAMLAGQASGDTIIYPPGYEFIIKTKDSVVGRLSPADFFLFRDSIIVKTKDTLFQLNENTVLLGIYVPPYIVRTSDYVFTDKEGYIVIRLPEPHAKQYDLVFMEEDETHVLELKGIKEPYLILDKTNFYHAGWYKFELRENGKIKERNKVFLPRDFSP